MSPTGGIKDTLAPKVVSSVPKNLSTQYKGNKVVLLFNEWIKTDKLDKELLITPAIKKYKTKEGKNRLEITLLDTLRENTTYSFNFREAIRDISEKNIAANISLSFATGNVLDSLKISGNLVELFTANPLKDAIVSLYPAFDTLKISKHKPFYYTLSDKNGNYTLQNIRAGAYNIFALKDKNNNGFYDEGELLGFLDSTLVLKETNLSNINFKLSKEDYTPAKYRSQTSEDSLRCEVSFSEGIMQAYPDSGAKFKPYLYEIKQTESNTLVLYKLEALRDSLPVRFVVYDSLGNRTDTVKKISFKQPEKEKKDRKNKEKENTDKPPKKTKIMPEIKLLSGEGIEKLLEWQLKFELPIIKHNFNKIIYWVDKDTANKKPLISQPSDYSWNSAQTILQIRKNISFYQKLHIQYDSTAFIDLKGDSCKAFKISYEKKDADKFGNILGDISTKERKYLVQLLSTNFTILKEQAQGQKFSFGFLNAGAYLLRVLIDENNNGRFDQGNYQKKKLPENMLIFKVNPDVREKWDIKNDLTF